MAMLFTKRGCQLGRPQISDNEDSAWWKLTDGGAVALVLRQPKSLEKER